ncbi:acyl-CoA Delta(11) desaturase [Nasonia vitripennis]|uniref:Fatty acid desaturase domain-containing protein n=1 Tax=Nasonia vitripennis TaxID=7425 RepID=A0A7M7G552_NASVI|nr:acyl-CoA Delta(11) desaturase [Nasonia vitripennis]
MYSSTVTEYENPPDKKITDSDEPTAEIEAQEAEQPIIWFNVFGIAALHLIATHSVLFKWREPQLYTWIFNVAWIFASGVGVTAGAHRLWAHRSYSANLPLRILLATLFCMIGQTHMHKWIRDHRTHHKFTETKADPHDSRRGFFFSHVGWLMMKRHPAVIEYGKKIDMSDIEADPVIQWFDRYYDFTMCTLCFVIPSLIIHYGWNEPWDVAILSVIVRYVFTLNATFCVNSLAHMLGNKPYNKKFRAVENAGVSFFALGEGWHNYHHAFPWDYKAAELPSYGLNLTTAFIDFFASIGWAYNLKTPSKEVIERVSLSKGDGTASKWGVDYHQKKQEEEQKVR